MRLQQIQYNYLYEGLDNSATHTIMLWESAGIKLKEAALTVDQINQIFQGVEQSATDAGGNRTMIGQGKDAAMAVNKAWEDLKTKMQNSAPVENYDQKVSDVLSKIGMGAKDPKFNGEVSGWVQKYRDFTEKHPIAQGAIYATLIALAGLTGAGLGGAAVLGLLKLADKVLQGERFSSAAYAGVKTGAMAYGASKFADMFKDGEQVAGAATKGLESGLNDQQVKMLKDLGASGKKVVMQGGHLWYEGPNGLTMIGAPRGASVKAMLSIVKSAAPTSESLVENQIRKIFYTVERKSMVLDEGIGDALKGAVGKAAGKLQQVGKNLTTKVTADKLMKAWTAAGSPTDSDQVAEILRKAGVNDDIIGSTYQSMNIPAPAAAATQVDANQAGKDNNTNEPTQSAPANTTTMTAQDIIAKLAKLDKKGKQRLLAYLQKQLGTA